MVRFLYKSEPELNQFDSIDVQITLPGSEHTVEELRQAFSQFLLAIGYHPESVSGAEVQDES